MALMTTEHLEELLDYLEGPEGCNFHVPEGKKDEEAEWTCDGTLAMTEAWLRREGHETVDNLAAIKARGGAATARSCSTLMLMNGHVMSEDAAIEVAVAALGDHFYYAGNYSYFSQNRDMVRHILRMLVRDLKPTPPEAPAFVDKSTEVPQ